MAETLGHIETANTGAAALAKDRDSATDTCLHGTGASIKDLDTAVEHLSMIVSKLEERLGPVSLSRGEADDDLAKAVPEEIRAQGSAVAERIRGLAGQVDHQGRRIGRVLDRLDV